MVLINRFNLIALFCFLILVSCSEQKTKTLPYLGIHTVENGDSVYFKLPVFEFHKQDSTIFGTKELSGKPYIAYFFFTSCPSICPRMTQGAKRIQNGLEKYKNKYNIVAFSIDPDRDNFKKLQQYAIKYDADLTNWHFIRGEEKDIYAIGKQGFYLGMSKDKNEPGGYMHSEKMVLVDDQGHLRGYYAGTDPNEVKSLINDMKLLIKEND